MIVRSKIEKDGVKKVECKMILIKMNISGSKWSIMIS